MIADFVDWVRVLLDNYPTFEYLIIFFAAGFGGELAIITLGFLSAQGVFPLASFASVAFLGTLSADMLWFWMGKTVIVNKILSHKYTNSTVVLISEAIKKVSGGNHLLAMIFAKFLVGTRAVLIMYVAKTGISFKKFVLYNGISVLIWLSVVIPIGYVSGLGFTYLSQIFENIYAGIGFVLLIALGLVFLQIGLKKYFTKEGEEILEEK